MRKTGYDGIPLARFKPAVVLVALTLALYACYPGDPTDISEFDTVTTLFDGKANWGSFQTYVMPDTIVHIVEEDQDTLPISRLFDQDILDLVRQRIEGYGYTEPQDPETNPPDVVFLVSVTASESWVGWISRPCGDWWGWWPGWGWYSAGWVPGWGCWYPPSGGVARYTTGTLFVDMVDPKSPLEDGEDVNIPVYWIAAMNGLLTSGSSPQVLDRLDRDINRAFDQSPYLEVSP